MKTKSELTTDLIILENKIDRLNEKLDEATEFNVKLKRKIGSLEKEIEDSTKSAMKRDDNLFQIAASIEDHVKINYSEYFDIFTEYKECNYNTLPRDLKFLVLVVRKLRSV